MKSVALGRILKGLLLSGAMMAVMPGTGVAQSMEKKGTTPYVTHFIFIPVKSIDVANLARLPCWTLWALLRI